MGERLGKLGYVVIGGLIVTLSKIIADQTIRVWTQSNPALFPSGQQALTTFYTILLGLCLTMVYTQVVLLFRVVKFYTLMFVDSLLTMLDIFFIREMLGLPKPRFRLGMIANVFPYVFALVPLFILLFSL